MYVKLILLHHIKKHFSNYFFFNKKLTFSTLFFMLQNWLLKNEFCCSRFNTLVDKTNPVQELKHVDIRRQD